jgi:uncharacterized cupin superfamily protein
MKKADSPIVNLSDLEYKEWQRGRKYAGRMGEIAERIGGEKLGYSITAIAPGKRAFPRHCHHVNEEMFFVLEGEGELRLGDKSYPVRKGDFICCPAGGPETAHQFINTMETGELKFLGVSTMQFPEICEYPGTGKKLVHHEWTNPVSGQEETCRIIIRAGEGQVDYWDGEE